MNLDLIPCDAPATVRFEIYSPADGRLHGSLEGAVHVCEDHAAAARAAAEAIGATAFQAHGDFTNLGACSTVRDYAAMLKR